MTDHSNEPRWLMYGSELDSQLSPIMTGLAIVVVLICILLVLYITRSYGPAILRLVARLRRKPMGRFDEAQLRADVRAMAENLATLSELPGEIAALRADVRTNTEAVDHLRGEVAGAADTTRAIVREAADQHVEAATTIRAESERIHRVDEKLSRIIAVLPPGGTG